MSSTEDRSHEIAESTGGGAGQHHAEHPSRGAGEGTGGAILLFFILGLAASMIVGWIIFPKLLYSQKQQPIDFNHALQCTTAPRRWYDAISAVASAEPRMDLSIRGFMYIYQQPSCSKETSVKAP